MKVLFVIAALMFVVWGTCASAQTPSDSLVPPSPMTEQLPSPISPVVPPSPTSSSIVADPTTLTPSWPMYPVPGSVPDMPALSNLPVPLVQSRWYARGESMFLHLSRGSTQPLVYDLIDAGVGHPGAIIQSGPVLTTNDISSQSFQALPRLTLGYQYQDGVAIEASYFGWNNWSGSSGVNSSPTGSPAVVYLETPDTLASDQVLTSLSTSINSGELNVSQSFPNRGDFEFLTGFRYFRLNERFNLHTTRTAGTDLYQSDYTIQTTNNLYGGQIGLRWGRSWNRLSISGTGKTGLYVNDASQNQSFGYSKDSTGFLVRDVTASKPTMAFIQELGLNGIYQFNDHWSIRGGYNLFVISQVARASDQIDFSTTPVPAFNTHGTAVLHGPSAGIEFRF